MEIQLCDVTTFALLDHESMGYTFAHERSLLLFRENVIRPSLRALDAEIDKVNGSDDEGAVFYAGDLAELFAKTVAGYVLTVQSMWERGLRELLVQREKKLFNGKGVAALQGASWNGRQPTVHDHFLRLMGFSLQSFDSYPDLDLLQNLGNAIRHGDGGAARRIHQLCPNLWWGWFAPGEKLVAGPFQITWPSDAEKHPSFADVSLPEALLEQMILSVQWFWQDIENMRCNSFASKAPPVVSKLSTWTAERQRRPAERVWSVDDPRGLLNRGE